MQATSSQIKTRHYTRSSSFKMALLFTVLCGFSVIILGYFTYYFTRGHFIYGTEAVIDTEIRNAAAWYRLGKLPEMIGENAAMKDRIYLLLDAKDQKIAGNLDELPHEVSLLSEGIIIIDRLNGVNRQFAAKIHTFPDDTKLLIGVEITRIAAKHETMQILSIVMIVLMLLVIAVSYAISSFVVSRTNRIALTARRIMMTGDLSERIKVDSRWDDLSYVARVLNEFLERTQILMQGIRQVSDNIAHDLRTPLTRLRNQLEEIKKETGEEKLEKLIGEADHVLTTFNAILRITRIETGRQRGEFRLCDLKELMQDVIELYEPLAEEKNITLSQNLIEAEYVCDRDLMFQAVSNILDNAIKFTPQGGTIHVDMARDEKLHLRVSDSGSGIPDGEKQNVFKRFYRSETSRHMPGNGLGLALVAAVVDLHGGEITLSDAKPQGLCIEITL